MNTKILRTAFVAILTVFILTGEQAAAKVPSAPYGSVTFQVFYDQLSPHGSWVQYQNYGYAWIPSVGGGFTPYSTGGNWIFSDYGWTWRSTYSWGWAPFHYGRWVYDNWYGWIWIPGYEWAPAWVAWGYYDTYYGWAPLPPGYGIGYRPPHHHWIFCPSGYITYTHINRYVVTKGVPRDKVVIIDNYDSGRNYYYGPRREAVEKTTGKPVIRVTVAERNTPGTTRVSGNRVEMYRPDVTKGNAAPARVQKLEDVKPNKPSVQPRGGDDVYNKNQETPQQRGDRAPNVQERGAPQQRDENAEREQAPQQRAPQVQERGAPQQRSGSQRGENMERQQAPQQKNPNVHERGAPQRNAPQQREQMERQQAPQQTPRVQERVAPRQNMPQQRQPRVSPQQRNNPPVQPRTPAPQPSQRGGKVTPR